MSLNKNDEDMSTVYSYSDTIYFIDSEDEGLNDIKKDLEELDIAKEDKEYTVLCVDIGILHLGFSGLLFDDEFNFIKVFGVDMIDITDFQHPEGVDMSSCHLHHTKTFTDWMGHVFWRYSHVFDGVDAILIERQPPQGLVAVEQLIFSRYREKCELISPNSMHKHFSIGHMDYERRKEATMNIATYHISDQTVLAEYYSFDRKHDIADAVCLGLFWLKRKRDKYVYDQRLDKARNIKMTFRGSDLTMKEWFEQFRYVSSYRRYIPI
ncbi:hypothetical protein N9189_03555 [Pirellulaceae bacterium]|nr:hypothetical protein [Pirellulaceae bacterium]